MLKHTGMWKELIGHIPQSHLKLDTAWGILLHNLNVLKIKKKTHDVCPWCNRSFPPETNKKFCNPKCGIAYRTMNMRAGLTKGYL